MTRQDKIRLLNDIARGKTSIDEIDNKCLSKAEIWFFDEKADSYTSAKTGEEVTGEYYRKTNKQPSIYFR